MCNDRENVFCHQGMGGAGHEAGRAGPRGRQALLVLQELAHLPVHSCRDDPCFRQLSLVVALFRARIRRQFHVLDAHCGVSGSSYETRAQAGGEVMFWQLMISVIVGGFLMFIGVVMGVGIQRNARDKEVSK